MNPNDQQHAKVADAMKQLANELAERFIGWPLPKTVCADLVSTMHGEANRIGTNLLSFEEAKQMMMEVVVPILTARESLLTASNEDLARQIEEKDAANQSLQFRVGCLENEHVEHEKDYLTVWKLIKKPDESVVQAVERTIRERNDLAAQVVKLTERAEKAEYIKQDVHFALCDAAIKFNTEQGQKVHDLRELATKLADNTQSLLNDGNFIEQFPDEARQIKQPLEAARKANLLK